MPRIALGPPGPTAVGSVKGLGAAASAPAADPAELLTPVIAGPDPVPFNPPPEPVAAHPGGVRDRDIRAAIRDALLATGAYDEIVLGRQEDDYTTVGIESRKLIIEPLDQALAYHHDWAAIENLMVDSRIKLSFLSRCDDPQIRDDRLEAMVNAAYNTMLGVSWLSLTFPAFTQFVQHARWMPPKHPVRRVDAIYSYRYEPDTTFDVTE